MTSHHSKSQRLPCLEFLPFQRSSHKERPFIFLIADSPCDSDADYFAPRDFVGKRRRAEWDFRAIRGVVELGTAGDEADSFPDRFQ